ncbi:MAG: LytTR family transcriptional regulator DNA-binding domain-containing protein [Saprospiraceae bacterium]
MKKVKYRDLPFLIIGSVLIAQLLIGLNNRPWVELLFFPSYYVDLLGVSASVFVVWYAIRTITIRLDRKFPWELRFAQRLLYQLLFGVGGMALLGLVLALLHFAFVIREDIRQGSFFAYEYPVSILIILLINAFYFAYYQVILNRANRLEIARLRHRLQVQPTSIGERQTDDTENWNPRTIIVSEGAHQIPILLENIRLAIKKGERVALVTEDNADYLINQSLDELEARLPEELFFRANRQAIVHFKTCKSFQNIENGKLKLLLNLPEEPLIISQKRAPAFKKWIAAATN